MTPLKTGNTLDTVMETLRRTRLCAACVARHGALASLRVDVVLRNLVKSAAVLLESDECHGCRQVTTVYRAGG